MNQSPVPEAQHDSPFRGGLSLPRDILIAPARAFAAIAAYERWQEGERFAVFRNLTWLPAYGVVAILGIVAGALEWPALAHVAATLPDADGHVPSGAAAAATASRTVLANLAVGEALTPLFFMSVTAAVVTFVARFKRNATPFGAFFALAAACLIPSAIGDLLGAIVVRAHDPSSFHDYRSIFLALPDNMGVFAAKGNERELFFLSRFGLFDIWSYGLLAFGIAALVPIRFMTAVALSFALDFALSLLG